MTLTHRLARQLTVLLITVSVCVALAGVMESAYAGPEHGFHGEYTDARGLVDLGQRWYDPRHQVFYSADPAPGDDPSSLVGDPRLTSSYTLNHHNSHRYTDPDGREPELLGYKTGNSGIEVDEPAAYYVGSSDLPLVFADPAGGPDISTQRGMTWAEYTAACAAICAAGPARGDRPWWWFQGGRKSWSTFKQYQRLYKPGELRRREAQALEVLVAAAAFGLTPAEALKELPRLSYDEVVELKAEYWRHVTRVQPLMDGNSSLEPKE